MRRRERLRRLGRLALAPALRYAAAVSEASSWRLVLWSVGWGACSVFGSHLAHDELPPRAAHLIGHGLTFVASWHLGALFCESVWRMRVLWRARAATRLRAELESVFFERLGDEAVNDVAARTAYARGEYVETCERFARHRRVQKRTTRCSPRGG